MKSQRGISLVELLLWIALVGAAAILVATLKDNEHVTADEVRRLSRDVADVPVLAKEWKEILAKYPTPRSKDIKRIRVAIEKIALARETAKTSGSSIDKIQSEVIDDYFKGKKTEETNK